MIPNHIVMHISVQIINLIAVQVVGISKIGVCLLLEQLMDLMAILVLVIHAPPNPCALHSTRNLSSVLGVSVQADWCFFVLYMGIQSPTTYNVWSTPYPSLPLHMIMRRTIQDLLHKGKASDTISITAFDPFDPNKKDKNNIKLGHPHSPVLRAVSK